IGDPLQEGAVPRARLAEPRPASRGPREGPAGWSDPPRDRLSRVRRRHDRVRHPHPDVPLPHHLAPGRRHHRMPRAPAQRGDAVSVTAAADGIKEIGTPLSDGDVESLRAGDRVRITGVLYTARDAAHGRLLPLIEKGEKLPFDPRGQIIYYTGPSPARPGDVVGSIGPTTASRMDTFTPSLLGLGLKGTIGKGYRSQPVKDALRAHKGVYFGAIGRSEEHTSELQSLAYLVC